jgi:hypothetical protein
MTKNLDQKTGDSKSNELAQRLNEMTELVATAAENGVSADALERKLCSLMLDVTGLLNMPKRGASEKNMAK